MNLSPRHDLALRTARTLLDMGHTRDVILNNSDLVPADLREWVAEQLGEEGNRTFVLARVISTSAESSDWLACMDRSEWHYWPTLRTYLLGVKGWPRDTVASLDDASDRILRELKPPSTPEFDIRGLVLGHVQSGKTANFTALIAKAADAGYRLVVVFSGIDNGLRRQTQIRLNRELTGLPHSPPGSVSMPPVGKQWHQFTTGDLDGDFNPGRANHAALQGSQPVLLVVKKNGHVLRRLMDWFQTAPENVRASLPALFIDDEADQASVDTRGSYQTEADFTADNPGYEPPAVINSLIRHLLGLFHRRAYVAYTATPFANILVPHDAFDQAFGDDLYPRDFLIDLPKPRGYFGTEEFFGRFDSNADQTVGGLDVIRIVPPEEFAAFVQNGEVIPALDDALCAYILGGAARARRGKPEAPCTMLVHTSQRIADQRASKELVESRFRDFRDEWRYNRHDGFRTRLRNMWDGDFLPTSAGIQGCPMDQFEDLEPLIGPFLECVVVREINSDRGEVLDYELEPGLKAIAVGGNRLSRGLTLEGLLVSFFARRAVQYDTLLQMARWYGYRGGYEDLSRIYTTGELAGWFIDLALVEHNLREDIQIYEQMPGLTPREVGMRILLHPAMQVTSPLKRRNANRITISQSYSGQLAQTFKFPFRDGERLAVMCEHNQSITRDFLTHLGPLGGQTTFGPLWADVPAADVVGFLRQFSVDPLISGFSQELISAWIELQNTEGELVNWTIVVRGRGKESLEFGPAIWLPEGCPSVWNVGRTRIKGTDSLGVITSPGDEAFGLTESEAMEMNNKIDGGTDPNRAARFSRSSQRGLLLLYPISRRSGWDNGRLNKAREPLFADPEGPMARDLVGMALSFPKTRRAGPAEAYLEGTARWRPVL